MNTRILIAQKNPIVGDVVGNTQSIIKALKEAQEQKCSLVVTSELALIGYPPKDLLLYPSLLEKAEGALNQLLPLTQGLTAFIGTIRKNTQSGQHLFNSVAVLSEGKLLGYYDKRLLPNYDVFNEKRYFEPGTSQPIFECGGKKIAVTICEDIWAEEMHHLYAHNPLDEIALKKPDLLINLSASPFELNKLLKRFDLCQKASQKVKCPVVFCNQVGANDSLVFDGYSFVCDNQNRYGLAKGFEEDHLVVDVSEKTSPSDLTYTESEQLYWALTCGIRDYFHKQGFKKALIGLSGGIDSAVVCVLTADAIGQENVTAVSMPSRYSSEHSVTDAQALAENLKVKLLSIPIESVHQSYLNLLQKPFENYPEDVTEENIQSRIRGMILMALSNKMGDLVLSCGNKSELAMGYATLYGDLNGGLAVISDLTKTQVYHLAQWMNEKKKVIPQNIIDKEPSAELRPNQKDKDSLPDYELLDQVIVSYVEKRKEAPEIAKDLQVDLPFVEKIIRQIHLSEYKRRQAPLGLKVTEKTFSNGWQFPIVHSLESNRP